MALLSTKTTSARWPRRRRFALWLVLLMSWLCAPRLETRAGDPPSREYQLKAVFLYNFAQFVNWPTNAFPSSQAPLVIGILGDDPFGPFLDATVRGESVSGHPLIIQRYQKIEDTTNCEILYIGTGDSKRIRDVLDALKGRCVLTVGDTDDFGRMGGIVRFVTVNNRIHLHINLDAARADHLTISSRLLRLADIVSTEKE